MLIYFPEDELSYAITSNALNYTFNDIHIAVLSGIYGMLRGSTRRPDRVMIDGRRVVVVDYKFGLRDAERHRRQMREYLRLLGEMGYAPAEGYLWYVKLGKIEKVEP